jgi:acetyltransferase
MEPVSRGLNGDILIPPSSLGELGTLFESSVATWTTKDGSPVVIRPIRAEDEPLLVKFHETLSERSVSLRYFHAMKFSQRVAHERLTRICFLDYDREMALVADHKEPWADTHEILGVGRLSKLRGGVEAEFALIINDRHQGRGIGTELLRRLLEIARDEKIARVVGEILPDNREMQRVCEKLGFRLEQSIDEPTVRAIIDLAPTELAPPANPYPLT